MSISAIGGVVCCGNISYDIPVWPVDQFNWGTTRWVEKIQHNIGGNGGNTSFALAKLGVPVQLHGCIGTDSHGQILLQELQSSAIDISTVQRSELPTNSSVCLVHPSGDRMFLHRPGASRDLDPSRIEFVGNGQFTHFHMANPFTLPVEIRAQIPAVLQRALAAGLTTSMDAGWDAIARWREDFDPCLEYTQLVFVNETEALHLSGHEDPEQTALALSDKGRRDVVVKLGSRGSVAYWGGAMHAEPAFDVSVCDTTGAGDCYAGGFLAAIAHGLDFRAATRFANAVGAMSVEHLGTVSGVGSWDETLQWTSSARVLSHA